MLANNIFCIWIRSLTAASCVVSRTLSTIWLGRHWLQESNTSYKIVMLQQEERLDSMLRFCQAVTRHCAHLPTTAHDHGTVLSSSQTL